MSPNTTNPATFDAGKFTPENAKQVLALPSACGVYLFDPQTLTQVRFIQESEQVEKITFSPDSKCWNVAAIVSTGVQSNKTQVHIRLMRISDGSVLRELTEAATDFDRAENLTFSPDGTRLISTQATFIQSIGQNRYGSRVNVWQVSDGRLVRKWDESEQVFTVTVSPDGSWIAFPNIDHTRFRRLSDGSKMRDVNWARNIVPSPDGKLIASRNEDRVLDGVFALSIWRLGDDNPATR